MGVRAKRHLLLSSAVQFLPALVASRLSIASQHPPANSFGAQTGPRLHCLNEQERARRVAESRLSGVAMASSLTSRGQPRCTKQRFARVPVAPVHIATSAQHPLPTFRLLSAVGREPAQNAKQQSHSARRHNSAAHRALKSARPRSRHARTQNNAPRTNQGHSLRGNNSAARRASAPARDIAPVCGRGTLCRAARTGPQPRPLMSQPRSHASR